MSKLKFDFENKNYVLMFTHSNILIEAAGVEKYICNQIKILQEINVSSIVIFPIANSKSLIGRFSKGYFGIIVNNQFVTVVDKGEILEQLQLLKSKNKQLVEIFIHHLKNYQLSDVEYILDRVNSKIKYFVHDFFALCSCSNLLKNDSEFCGLEYADSGKCSTCKYYDHNEHFSVYEKFFEKYCNRITMIYPSEFTKRVFESNYPMISFLGIVIPHLVFSVENREQRITYNNRPRIAFVGAPIHHKGWDDFIEVCSEFGDKYDFYHFGFSPIVKANCIEVPISFKTDGENAMSAAILKNNIDIVLMLTLCGETYCYTLYESLVAGAVPFAYSQSGNVGETVSKERLGITFNDLNSLKSFLSNEEKVVESIKKFKSKSRYYLSVPSTNKQILSCIDIYNSADIKPEKFKKILMKKYVVIILYYLRMTKRSFSKRKF